MSGKQLALRAIASLPDDATIEDVVAALEFVQNVEIGLEQLDAGLGIPDEEVRERLGLL